MKLLLLVCIVVGVGISGCSPDKKPEEPVKDKQQEAEETARKILNNRVIIKEQGGLTKEEAENAKSMITSPKSTDRRDRAIGKEAGGPPAPEGADKKEGQAERHIGTK